MKDGRDRTGVVATSVLLLVISAVACALRVTLGYASAFGEDVVVFRDTDAWYHMRLVDSLVHHFPQRIWFDPYLLHPGGQATQVAPMLDWVIAGVALLLGAGSPSPRLVALVGAYVPAIVGAVTTVPVYFLGREVFSRRAGLFGAAIIGVLPGEVLSRSLLGFTDHHCLEVLLSAATLALMTFALDVSLPPRRRVVYTVLTGIGLGAYLLAWSGGAFLVAVLLAWGIGFVMLERLRNADATGVVGVLLGSFAVSACMILPWVGTTQGFAREAIGLATGLVVIPLLWILGRLAHGRAAYLGAVLLAGIAGSLAVGLWANSILTAALREISGLSPARVSAIAEATPLFKTSDRYPFWRQFTASGYLALMTLWALFPGMVRRATAKHTLLLAWTATTAAATIGQLRFSYYLAISVALLAGAGCDLLLTWVEKATGHAGRHATASAGTVSRVARLALRASLAPAMAFSIAGPSVPYFRQLAEQRSVASEQLDAFGWMRENTPDPFGDPEFYYRVIRPRADDRSSMPVASYGVMASWESGYPMIRLAHRVPNANGTQAGARDLVEFLMAEDEDAANAILTRLQTRYVMTDWMMVERPSVKGPAGSRFASYALMAGRDPKDYRDVFYRRDPSGQLRPVGLYYPSYYRSMATRLHSFGGTDVTPVNSTWVISFSESDLAGRPVKEIQTEQRFARYDDAVAFLESVGSDRFRIVGRDPFVSCVPLPALREYAPLYRSQTRIEAVDGLGPPVVRIFAYRRWTPRLHSSPS